MTMFQGFSLTLTPDTSKLDSNFGDIESVLKWFAAIGYTGATPKLTIDANGNLTALSVASAVDRGLGASITSIGAVAIGVNNTGATNGFGIPTGYNYLGGVNLPLAISVGGAWRGTFDLSGNFFVSATGNTNAGVALATTGSVTIGNSAQASGWSFQVFARSNSAIGSITQSGTTAVLYNTTSDRRLKRNIVDAPECGAVIDAMKVRSFDWDGAPDEHVTHSFVAQELAEVAPQAVKRGDDGEEITDPWAIDPSKLVALLVREVQSLRTRIAALEEA